MTPPDLTHIAQSVLDFWYGPDGAPEDMPPRPEWFKKDAAFDRQIQDRFADWVDLAVAGELDGMAETPEGALALVILLDQFPRNIFRDDARAFAGDARAINVAKYAMSQDFDKQLSTPARWFLYLPFMHSEKLGHQEICVGLFAEMFDTKDPKSPYAFAVRHRDIIAAFGRFPHRNKVLGRESTLEELAHLAEHGGF